MSKAFHARSWLHGFASLLLFILGAEVLAAIFALSFVAVSSMAHGWNQAFSAFWEAAAVMSLLTLPCVGWLMIEIGVREPESPIGKMVAATLAVSAVFLAFIGIYFFALGVRALYKESVPLCLAFGAALAFVITYYVQSHDK
jgi:hypothetical membrane protein